MPAHDDWSGREVDVAYLLDSGLLFEINRAILHRFGLALVVRKMEEGLVLDIKDHRKEPEKLLFEPTAWQAGLVKYRQWVSRYGHKLLQRRQDFLGFCAQFGPVTSEEKRELCSKTKPNT